MGSDTSQKIEYWPELHDHLQQVRNHAHVQSRYSECCICYDELKVTGLNGFEGYASAEECEHKDIPLVLPCGHIIGRTCLFLISHKPSTPALWDLYKEEDHMDKCPLCGWAFYINATSGWVDAIHAPIFRDEDETVLPQCLPRPRNTAPNKERCRGDVLDETSLTQCWGLNSGKPFDRSRFSQITAQKEWRQGQWWQRLTGCVWLAGILAAYLDVSDKIDHAGLSDKQKDKIMASLVQLVQLALLWLLFFNFVAVLLLVVLFVRMF